MSQTIFASRAKKDRMVVKKKNGKLIVVVVIS